MEVLPFPCGETESDVSDEPGTPDLDELSVFSYEDEFEDTSDYVIITEFMEEGQLKILQSARRVSRDYYECPLEEGTLGASILSECFEDSDNLSSSELFSRIKLDAKTLKSHLSLDLHPRDYIKSKKLGKKLGYYPDWNELARYIRQLKESEGFDLSHYNNLGKYCHGSPIRMTKGRMSDYANRLEESLKVAMKFYEEAGGGELKEGELVKANYMGQSRFLIFYMTFTAKSCLDGKIRHYQAQVEYDAVEEFVWPECHILVRLKKEQTTERAIGDIVHMLQTVKIKCQLDAKTLKSYLSLDLHPRDGINSKWLGPLKESEGFDLSHYNNLGKYGYGSPIRMTKRRMSDYANRLEESLKVAMKFYEEAGGGELKEGELVKANYFGQSKFLIFYMTFTAKSCLDGKVRHYPARVQYDAVEEFVWPQSHIMVRLKKEQATERAIGDIVHMVQAVKINCLRR